MLKVKLVRQGGAYAVTPKKQSRDAAGYDLYAIENTCIEPGKTELVPLGFAMEIINPGLFPVCASLHSRSGLAHKYGLVVHAEPKIIDPDFRGEVVVPMKNEGKTEYVIRRGERIAQMTIREYREAEWEWVEEEDLSRTPRGKEGFGSTGKW